MVALRSGPLAPTGAITWLLTLNGGFLVLVGAIQLALELIGHAGAGPYASMFADSPYTIGFAEAHGLALLVGATLLAQRRQPVRRLNHVLPLCAHLLLGTANIVFWASFTTWGLVVPGLVATIGHGVFVLAHGVVLTRLRAGAGSDDLPHR